MATSRRRTSRHLRRNAEAQDVAGCVFVHDRAARTAVAAALRASGMRRTYLSRAESGGTARYVIAGTQTQYEAFLAALPADCGGVDVYLD